MASTFETFYQRILVLEGGQRATDNPDDRGGRTQGGVSERAHPDVWEDGKVTVEEQRRIYREIYGTCHIEALSELNETLAFQVFDFAVTSGPANAGTVLQRAYNAVRRPKRKEIPAWPLIGVDGSIGPETLSAIRRVVKGGFVTRFLIAYKGLRIAFYCAISLRDDTQLTNIGGWLHRVGLPSQPD